MSGDRARKAVGWFAGTVAVLAAFGAAVKAVRDGAAFLWPVGVVIVLGAACLFEGLLLWVRRGSSLTDPSSSRERRESGYEGVLLATEPYINAHRAAAITDGVDVYLPDIEEAENAVAEANGDFVAAHQRVEQWGNQSVLDAALAIEDAVNRGDLDEASRLRREQLVPAVRDDMDQWANR